MNAAVSARSAMHHSTSQFFRADWSSLGPAEVTPAAEQEVQTKESTIEKTKEPESAPEKTKAAKMKGKETDAEKKPKKKGSIHKRLKENKEKLEKQQGKEKPQKGVELSWSC